MVDRERRADDRRHCVPGAMLSSHCLSVDAQAERAGMPWTTVSVSWSPSAAAVRLDAKGTDVGLVRHAWTPACMVPRAPAKAASRTLEVTPPRISARAQHASGLPLDERARGGPQWTWGSLL